MNIEINENTFKIDNKLKIDKNLTKRAFLKYFIKNKPKIHIKNPPYISYLINCNYIKYKLMLVLHFKNKNLIFFNFSIDSELYGKSWDDFSKDNEVKRKRKLEEIVKEMKLTIPIDICFEEKSGNSSVTIRYI